MAETLIDCPSCGRKKFYFNSQKMVGLCFRASCNFKAGPQQLLKLGLVSTLTPTTDHSSQVNLGSPAPIVTLPPDAVSLVHRVNGDYETHYPIAVGKVQERGVSVQDQYRFDLRIDPERIYIPIYKNNDKGEAELKQYVSRAHWWYQNDYIRYKYFSGVSSKNYIFNWDEMGKKEYITIVENTFNAIRYRILINSTTCFGSAVSAEQMSLICQSAVKFVILLFDAGAEGKAEKTAYDLKNLGVDTKVLFISGQPDDHSDSYITEIVHKII